MSFILPSHFGSPFITTVSETRYDARGRQLNYTETEVQRLERLAFVNASKSRSGSPVQSLNSASSSPSSSPTSSTRKLISEPYSDPIELMANRLAELMFNSDDFSSSSDEEHYAGNPAITKSKQHVPTIVFSPPPAKVSTAFKQGHRRSRSSLSAIPEED